MKPKKPVQIIDPDRRVMTLREWSALSGFSYATAKRHKKDGTGPRFILIGKKMLGVRMCDHIAWQESRMLDTPLGG
jgi:predicted DNA-binding transcriptional regulator AlpA